LEHRGLREWAQNECRVDWLGGVEWIQLAQDRERLQALVNTWWTFRYWHHRVTLSSPLDVCSDMVCNMAFGDEMKVCITIT